MKRTRRSLLYVAAYLIPTGLGLVLAPQPALKMLKATGTFGDFFVRFSGILMFGLGLMVIQIIRHHAEILYPSTLLVRGVIWPAVLVIYLQTGDPVFLVVLAVMGLGMILSGISLARDLGQDMR